MTVPLTADSCFAVVLALIAVNVINVAHVELSGECCTSTIVVPPVMLFVEAWSVAIPPEALEAALSTLERAPREPKAIDAPVVRITPLASPRVWFVVPSVLAWKSAEILTTSPTGLEVAYEVS